MFGTMRHVYLLSTSVSLEASGWFTGQVYRCLSVCLIVCVLAKFCCGGWEGEGEVRFVLSFFYVKVTVGNIFGMTAAAGLSIDGNRGTV